MRVSSVFFLVDLTANNIFRGHVSFLWKISAKIHVKADKLFSPWAIRVAPSMFQKVFTSMTMFLIIILQARSY